jgi:hypothetical protein
VRRQQHRAPVLQPLHEPPHLAPAACPSAVAAHAGRTGHLSGSMPAVGSSSSTSPGSPTVLSATLRRRRCPPLHVPASTSARCTRSRVRALSEAGRQAGGGRTAARSTSCSLARAYACRSPAMPRSAQNSCLRGVSRASTQRERGGACQRVLGQGQLVPQQVVLRAHAHAPAPRRRHVCAVHHCRTGAGPHGARQAAHHRRLARACARRPLVHNQPAADRPHRYARAAP